MESARVDQPSWSSRYLAPGFGWGDKQQTPALEVLAEILGGGSTSRMYRSLVVDKAVAVSAGSWYSPEGLWPQTFGIYATPAQGVEIADLEKAVETELALMLRDGVTEGEVATAVKRMRRGSIFARDDVLYPARLFGRTLASGGTIADVEEWPDRIAAVTPEAVLEAARTVLVPDSSTTSVLLSKPAS